MSQLPTREDLLRQKEIEKDALARPHLRALAIERDLLASRAQCWELVEEFVERARELAVAPQIWQSASEGGYTPRITWVEGYRLTSGSIASAPPLRYCVAERRRVRRAQHEERAVEELSLFVASSSSEAGLAVGLLEHHTKSRGGWPRIERLEHAAGVLTGLRRELETSLLALMD